jgi:hypothetical protein
MFLVLPYVLNYDFGVAGAALALFIRREEEFGRRFATGEQMLLALTMLLPLVMIGIGRVGVDLGPIVLLGVCALMMQRTGAVGDVDDRLRIWGRRLCGARVPQSFEVR